MRTFIVARQQYKRYESSGLKLEIYHCENKEQLAKTLVGYDDIDQDERDEMLEGYDSWWELFEEMNGDGWDWFVISELKGNELIAILSE